MRFLTMLTAGLLGAVPGALLMTIGWVVTDGGGDGMIPFGMGGVLLIFVGFIFGAVFGWRRSGQQPSRT